MRAKQKTRHVGFELLIRGYDVWKAQGFNFASPYEAREYCAKNFPRTLPSDTRIRGVRVNVEPLTVTEKFNAR